MSRKSLFSVWLSFIFLSKCLAKAWWRLKLWPECHTTLAPSLRGWDLPVWLLVLPLWAVWKIHQALPLESVRIREQALQWPHTRHIFINRHLAAQMWCLGERQITADTSLLLSCRFGAAQAYRCTHTGISSPELLKTDGLYPFHCSLFTLMVWDLTFTVCECESSWLYLPPGRTATTVLPTSKHTALPSVRKPETQRGCRDWPE